MYFGTRGCVGAGCPKPPAVAMAITYWRPLTA